MIPLTKLAHDIVAAVLQEGDTAIDATVGNGHDTVFLAQTVGPGGSVYGFDVQQLALEKTQARLDDLGLINVILLNRSHEQMAEAFQESVQGTVSAIMFNLGYLPGGDKSLTTRTTSTLAGLQQALTLLAPGGVITILAYPGHAAGVQETKVVVEFLEKRSPEKFEVRRYDCENQSDAAPRLYVVHKI